MKYFDYASTTPIREEVLQAYTKILSKYYANADSMHDLGRESQRLMEKSRAQIAQLLSVGDDEIIFTSCASESNNYAIKGFALQNQHRGKHIITSCVEHSSILRACEQLEEVFGFEVTYLPLTKDGVIDKEELKNALRKDTILVSIMCVNNETGAINAVEELADIVHTTRAQMHVDYVQALGKIPICLDAIDMATFSAHKIYGLKGSAILYRRKHISLLPLISGGQQEMGVRGGTSNAPANIVFAKTLRLALDEQKEHTEYVQSLHDLLCDGLKKMNHVSINSPQHAVPHIVNVAFAKIGSEIMLNALNERGFCVSAQSTCSSKSKNLSQVLLAMGLSEHIATHSIRISISHLTSNKDINDLLRVLKEINHDYQTR